MSIPANFSIGVLAFAMLILSLASTFTFAKSALYVIFALAVAVPFLRPNAYFGYRALNLAAGITIGYNLVVLVLDPAGWNSIYNGLLTVLFILLLPAFGTIVVSAQSLDFFVMVVARLAWVILLAALTVKIFFPHLTWAAVSGFLFLVYYFVLINPSGRKFGKMLYGVGLMAATYMSDDRSYLIALLVLAVLYIVWPVVVNDGLVRTFFFPLSFAALSLFPIVYAALSMSRYREELDRLSLEFTGGRFFSGRDTIWLELLEGVRESPLFGSGHYLVPVSLDGLQVSAHNAYMAILSRTGVVGLLVFFLLLASVAYVYTRRGSDKVIRITGAYTMAILFQQSFELHLIGNNVSLGLLCWLVISFGLVYLNSQRAQEFDSACPSFL